jgi:hypothetical protein
LLLALCLLGLQTSCEQIIGLEDRKLVDGGGVQGLGSELCSGYCKSALQTCKAPIDAYTSEDDCRAVCSFLPPGSDKPSDTNKNTVSCRAHNIREAASIERDTMFCPAASPGGGSPGEEENCGEICEAYCGLHATICPDKPQTSCLKKCRAIPDLGKYSASKDYNGGDTIQCRIAHLTAAARASREGSDDERADHCGHSLLRASLGDRPYCDLNAETEPNCKDYCKVVMESCGDFPVYDSDEQCEKVCEKGFVKGKNTDAKGTQDSTSDTLACRRWHSYFAFDDQAMTHCPHAGPTGDGHCGKICPTYCGMLKRGCSAQFDTTFPGAGGMNDCQAACEKVPGYKEIDMKYNLKSEETRTDTLLCRMRQLVLALEGKDTCAKALPKGTCSQ